VLPGVIKSLEAMKERMTRGNPTRGRNHRAFPGPRWCVVSVPWPRRSAR
jgi:hypothetical protein